MLQMLNSNLWLGQQGMEKPLALRFRKLHKTNLSLKNTRIVSNKQLAKQRCYGKKAAPCNWKRHWGGSHGITYFVKQVNSYQRFCICRWIGNICETTQVTSNLKKKINKATIESVHGEKVKRESSYRLQSKEIKGRKRNRWREEELFVIKYKLVLLTHTHTHTHT